MERETAIASLPRVPMVRAAQSADAPAIRGLLAQLGYVLSEEVVTDKLELLRATGTDWVSVAEHGGRVVGLAAVHVGWMLHAEQPVARLTTLVVDSGARGQGLGRMLVHHAIALARQAGCGRIELTTATERSEAQAFYRRLGFASTSLRFHRDLV